VSESAISKRRRRELVLDVPVDVLPWTDAVERIFEWADRRESRTVCICNVHSLVTARRNATHADAIRSADLVTPDGAPVAWMLRKKGHRGQERISGPDLMWDCCWNASRRGTEMFLYGATPEILWRLQKRVSVHIPGIKIVGAFSPPFHELSAAEDAAMVSMINRSGARIVWVGLGCPKQEAWLQAHRGRVQAVMVGVGAAFDFHAGAVKRAPIWIRRSGFEWLHRLWQEPRRLAARYIVANTIFIIAILRDFLFAGRRVRDY
jgi:N-acetylglucosaminyldiphosphoundecaprenol N-acetyl-beta-D-mannosaminyltransferase